MKTLPRPFQPMTTMPEPGSTVEVKHATGFVHSAKFEHGKWFIPGTEQVIWEPVTGWRERE